MGAIRAWGKEGGEFYAAWDKEDTAKAIEHETLRADEAQAERQKAVLARKARANQAREVDLDDTKAKLVDHLSALPSGGSKEDYLKGQHRGHMVRAAARSHKFPFKTKMGADAKGVGASVAHLTAVVVLMIDAAPEVLDLAEEEDCVGFRRKLPSASVDLRSGLVDKAAVEDVAEAAALALRDDPELVELRCTYANTKSQWCRGRERAKAARKRRRCWKAMKSWMCSGTRTTPKRARTTGCGLLRALSSAMTGRSPQGAICPSEL